MLCSTTRLKSFEIHDVTNHCRKKVTSSKGGRVVEHTVLVLFSFSFALIGSCTVNDPWGLMTSQQSHAAGRPVMTSLQLHVKGCKFRDDPGAVDARDVMQGQGAIKMLTLPLQRNKMITTKQYICILLRHFIKKQKTKDIYKKFHCDKRCKCCISFSFTLNRHKICSDTESKTNININAIPSIYCNSTNIYTYI